jgi:hypothetical protein
MLPSRAAIINQLFKYPIHKSVHVDSVESLVQSPLTTPHRAAVLAVIMINSKIYVDYTNEPSKGGV